MRQSYETASPEIDPRRNRAEFLQKQEKASAMRAAFAKAEKILEEMRAGKYALSEADKARVEREARFHKDRDARQGTAEGAKLATVLEAMLCDLGSAKKDASGNIEPGWLGSTGEIVPSSLYSDFFEGIDNFIIFRDKDSGGEGAGEEFVALATDVTFSTSARDVEKKLERIRENILNPIQDAKIKYLPTGQASHAGFVPRVVIAIDGTHVEELAERWAKKEKNKKILENHPTHIQILYEIFLQCQFFKDFAQRNGKESIAAEYEKMEYRIWNIVGLKLQERGKSDYSNADGDEGYQQLIQGLNRLSPGMSVGK